MYDTLALLLYMTRRSGQERAPFLEANGEEPLLFLSQSVRQTTPCVFAVDAFLFFFITAFIYFARLL